MRIWLKENPEIANEIAEKNRAEGLVNPIITEDVLDETDGEMPEEMSDEA